MIRPEGVAAVLRASHTGQTQMPQLQLPMFPAGATAINKNVAVQSKDGKVVYFHGHLPVFQHEENSLKSFRYFTSHMIDAGTIRAADVARTFGVPLATVIKEPRSSFSVSRDCVVKQNSPARSSSKRNNCSKKTATWQKWGAR